MTKLIGLTGGIGSGKSTVCKILNQLGFRTIDMDRLAHQTYAGEGSEAYDKIVALFGNSILDQHNQVDRKVLGEIVFNDPDAMKKLTSIVWPIVDKLLQDEINASDDDIIFVESALLVESGTIARYDQIWVVVAYVESAVKRLMEYRSLAELEALTRIDSQISNEDRCLYADVIIYNNDDLNHLRQQVEKSLEGL